MKESLIKLVYVARPVWDKRHKQHHNRHVLGKVWKNIASQLGVVESEAKTVWKNLRQEFGKQLRKMESGETPDEVCPWPFFKKLEFLKDQFGPRPSTLAIQDNEDLLNDPSLHGVEPDVEIFEMPDDMPDIRPSQRCTTPESSSSFTSSRAGYMKWMSPHVAIGQELLQIEKEKLDLAKRKRTRDVNDEDVGFFNSLMPTVKTLSQKDKFVFRMKVQEILYQLAFNVTTPTHTQPATSPLAFIFNPPTSTITSQGQPLDP